MSAMEPHIDQLVHSGYGAVDSDFLDTNTLVPCSTNGSLRFEGCGANNAKKMISYILNGSAGSADKPCQSGLGMQSSFPCKQASWSSVLPKSKLVLGVGWYNNQVNLSAAARGVPQKLMDNSFCRASNWSKFPGVTKQWQADTQTWVFDRKDPYGSGMRVWFDDEASLAPKYAAVRAAGWSGLAIWLANGMFSNDCPEDRCGQAKDMSDYCPQDLARMWASIKSSFVMPA